MEVNITLPETNSLHLKMDGWKMNFLLGMLIFRGDLPSLGMVSTRMRFGTKVCLYIIHLFLRLWPIMAMEHGKDYSFETTMDLCKVGPLPLITGVITPISRVITPVTHL